MTIDTLARRLAQPASRRTSLLTLGGSGLAAIVGLSTDAAGKKRKNHKKKDDKKCKQQVDQCNGFFAPLCLEIDPAENCPERTGACCALLGTCQADDFITCLLTLINSSD